MSDTSYTPTKLRIMDKAMIEMASVLSLCNAGTWSDRRCPKSKRKLAREKRKHKKLRRKQGRH